MENKITFLEEVEFDFKHYFSLLIKRRWLILSIVSIVVIFTFVYNYKQIPIYRATATILIESPTGSLSLSETQRVRLAPQIGSKEYYNTQYRLLESPMLAKRVVKKLNLPISPEYLAHITEITPVRRTRLVRINVDYKDPVMATKIANGIVSGYIEQNIESMLFMSKEVLKAFPDEAKQIEKGSTYGQLKELDREESLESLPPIAQDPLLRTLKSKKVEIQTQLANLGKRYKDKHPKLAMLKAELKFIDNKIDIETDRILRSVKADLAGRLQANNIRVISYAEVPGRPIKPQKVKNLIYAVCLSLIFSVGFVFFTDYLDDTIRNQADIEKKLVSSYLGSFPELKSSVAAKLAHPIDFDWLYKDHDVSVAIGTIKTNILFSAPKDKLKTVLITSSMPQEGKSLLSSFIAYAFAKGGTKTLLVDADIRKPTICKIFGLERSPGLTNLLVENVKSEHVIHRTKYPNLSVLTSGAKTPNPLELLSSEVVKTLLYNFLNKFEKVIIDAPPGLLLPDALVLSKICGSIVFVAKAGVISKDVLCNMKNKFSAPDTKVLGTVLNFFRAEEHSQYQHKSYYKYYKNYYASSTSEKGS